MAAGWPDVSNWQSVIDWGAVRADLEASGLPLVAITKATEGWGYTDPTFARNWSEMRRWGLRRGAYGFARPDLGSRAKDEADWLYSVARPEGDDFLIQDAEAGSGNLLWWVCEYMDELNALTRGQQGLYSGWWWMGPRNVYGPEIARRCWLHLAAYQSATPAPPPGWDSVAIQQFTSSGRLAGVAGDVDLNRSLGTFGSPAPAPAPAPAPKRRNPDMVIYQAEEDGAQFPYNGRVGEQLTPAQSAPLVHAGVPVEIVPRAVIDSYPKDGPLVVRGPDGTVVSPVAVWRHIPPSEYGVMLGDNAVVEQVDQATINGLLGIPPPK